MQWTEEERIEVSTIGQFLEWIIMQYPNLFIDVGLLDDDDVNPLLERYITEMRDENGN